MASTINTGLGLKTVYAPEAWKTKYIDGQFWRDYAQVPWECNVVYGSLVLAASERTFSAAAAKDMKLEVTAIISWTASSSASWLTVRTASGNGNGTLVYDVAENKGAEPRTATITITGGGFVRVFTVTQQTADVAIEWRYRVFDGTVSLGTGSSGNPAIPTWTTGGIVIPSTLDGYPVTSIGDFAFWNCSGLTSVTIPTSVTNIARYAFWYCSGLTDVTIPNSVREIGGYAFESCSGLTKLTLPDSVKEIDRAAFIGCSGLTNLMIPDSVTSIGDYVFMDCDALKTLHVPGAWKSKYVNGVFWREYASVPEGCTVVYDSPQSLLTLATNECNFSAAAADSQVLAVMANVDWTAQSSHAWLVLKTAIGGGNGTIVYNVEANTGTTSRTGSITVSGGGLTRTFTVTQDGMVATLELGAASRTFTPDVTAGMELSVTANVPWTAESAVAWLTLTAAGGTGNGIIKYDVAANPGTVERTGAITVTGGGLTRIFLATQSGQAARLELAENARTFTADSASGNRLAVSANVPWTVASSASWLAVRTPNGTEDGAVAYDIAENPGTGERMGAITVSGSGLTCIFLVTQGGKSETQKSPVGVPCQWLEESASGILSATGGDYEAAAMALAANGLPVWKCYVAGLSTTDAEAQFKVKSLSLADGQLKVEWTPDLNDNGTKTNRTYVIQGKQSLDDEWNTQTSSSRFFRVSVQMPPP